MAGLKSTLVSAAIALLIVEGVVRANHASMKYRRAAEVDMTCGANYQSSCCPDDMASAVPASPKCFCRCLDEAKETVDAGPRYCPAGHGPNEFTLVSLDTDELGDSAAGGGTGSTGQISRPNGIISYMVWIGIVFTLIYVSQIAQRH